MSEVKPLVLLVAAKWWPLSARMAIALLKNGCAVRAVCPQPHPLMFVDGLSGIYEYSSTDSLASLRTAISDCKPDVVVPCDDGAASQCRSLHEGEASLRNLIERSIGSPHFFPILESRYRFLNVARQLGLRIPDTQPVSGADDLIDWHRTKRGKSVFKVDGDSGGNGVRICESLAESLAAWRSLSRAPQWLAAWKRIVIDKDPLALWLRKQPRLASIQEFIEGRPANSMVFSWQGRVLALISVVVVAADGPTGAATIVRVIDDARMERAARALASKLQICGFFGLDFVIEKVTGTPYLIEINPRCTQLGHLELTSGSSLAASLAATLRGAPNPAINAAAGRERIALFPQASMAGSACKPYLKASMQDVPHEAPELVRELMKGPWPSRQLVARLYHAFNPTRKQAPAIYEDLNPALDQSRSPSRLERTHSIWRANTNLT